jgi:ATP-dependent Clp protease ATP-binding subunit ClpB
VDFTNTVIVMTSNAGSQVIQQVTEQGGSEDEMRDAVNDALKARFLPEFLNRIDDIVIFHPLNQGEIRKIVGLQIKQLAHRLHEAGLELSVSDAAVDEIAAVGYDPTYGARPLKRVIQKQIQNPLATAILKSAYDEGSTVYVDYNGSEFTFADQPTAQTVNS